MKFAQRGWFAPDMFPCKKWGLVLYIGDAFDLVFDTPFHLCTVYCAVSNLMFHFGRKVRGLSQKKRESNLLGNTDVYFWNAVRKQK